MSEEEIKIEKPDKIVEIVEEILKFNKQNQQGKGIKILTPNQMLSRLPISLAQLEAGNNSNKLKNEIRRLLHFLYRSKNMPKQVYNNLRKPICIKSSIIMIMIMIMVMIMIMITTFSLWLWLWLLLLLKAYIIKNGDNFHEYWK